MDPWSLFATSCGKAAAWFRRQGSTRDHEDSAAEVTPPPNQDRFHDRRARLLDRIPGLGYRSDLNRRVIEASQGALAVTGYRASDLVQGGPRLDDLVHPEDKPEVNRHLAAAIGRGKPAHFTYRLLAADGAPNRVWETVWPRNKGQDSVQELEGFITVLGEEKEQPPNRNGHRPSLIASALHDPLTGLSQRTLLCDRLDQVLRRAQRRPHAFFALLHIDLDNFRVVNEHHGREYADRLLEITARRLEACVRAEDTVARLINDQFAILLTDIDGVGAAIRVARRVLELLSLPLFASQDPVRTTASIGVVYGPASYQRPKEILRDAETAMCRAKVHGGNSHELFDRATHDLALARMQLERDLRQALDRGQFELFYQPIVSLPSGKIEGLEALLRWRHPERGLLRPEEFLQSAIECGLIVPITWWILGQACSRIASWRALFTVSSDLYVSINMHARQFENPDFIERVRDTLQRTELAAQGLRIEVKETTLMVSETVTNTLHQLRTLGVQLAVDDFGTGHSSVASLSTLPIRTLKVDRSFIAGIERNKDSAIAMIRTVVSMARGLTMEVVGEGVEHAEQAARLEELGCTLAQGYFFAHPGTAERVTKMLANGTSVAASALS